MHSHMLLRICKILWSNANVLTMVNIIPHVVDNVCTVCTYGKRWHDESDEGWDVVGAVLWLIWLEASASNSACHQPVRLPTPTSPWPGGYSEFAFVLISMKNPENLEKKHQNAVFYNAKSRFSRIFMVFHWNLENQGSGWPQQVGWPENQENQENLKKSTRMMCFTMQNQYFSDFHGFSLKSGKPRGWLASRSKASGKD